MRHYTIEWVDEEGDVNIKNVIATPWEIEAFVQMMTSEKTLVKVYDLSIVSDPDVKLFHETNMDKSFGGDER